ncbi:hypothetical protein EDC65_2362 [Stella humosa]|uniref:Uncharacterized protein n=1 Tax=Stella humosa TaxID=94 RepID=A0A3N1L7D8_9PROT|nr:hypothetical protein [Stella humosa]ROP90513.1 hypothetical protein EDC65_2362 [Stella humosa]BBK29594.1 hypothetical protein STHU_02280 [Stella humosa]
MLASLQQRLALAGRPGDEVAPQPAYLRRHVLAPVVVLAVLVLAGLAAAPIPGAYALLIASEQGIVENASALIALAGLVPAVAIMRHPGVPRPWLPVWAGCFVVGLAFIAAEEVSWGQQWFFWETPEWIGAVNTQNETNFHNYAKWSEDLPKTVLSLAVLATGILWPLWVLLGGRDGWIRRTPLHWIWPSAALWPSAVIAFGLRIAERLVANLPGADSGAPVFRSLREGLELFLILFVVAYLVDLGARLGRR